MKGGERLKSLKKGEDREISTQWEGDPSAEGDHSASQLVTCGAAAFTMQPIEIVVNLELACCNSFM